jgi:hypothetical protein
VRKNDLNIQQPPNGNTNAILRAEVELRDKNLPAKKRGKNKGKQFGTTMDLNVGGNIANNVDVPMEKVRLLFFSLS